MTKLSNIQIAALEAVQRGEVTLTCPYGTIKSGPVALKTLWSLENKELVKDGMARPKLTAFGSQIMYWREYAARYEDLLR